MLIHYQLLPLTDTYILYSSIPTFKMLLTWLITLAITSGMSYAQNFTNSSTTLSTVVASASTLSKSTTQSNTPSTTQPTIQSTPSSRPADNRDTYRIRNFTSQHFPLRNDQDGFRRIHFTFENLNITPRQSQSTFCVANFPLSYAGSDTIYPCQNTLFTFQINRYLNAVDLDLILNHVYVESVTPRSSLP